MDPKIEQAIELNAEHLRRILPLMHQHKIPATPENYAVWYHYVLGDEKALSARIDQAIAGQIPFSGQLNEELFALLNSPDQHLAMARIGEQLQALLRETSGAISATGERARSYDDTLQRLHSDLDDSPRQAASGMELLQAVLHETSQMRSSLQRMQQDFDTKSQEMDQLKVELEQVRHRATTDPLTGLANRTAFAERLETLIADAARNATPLHLLMFDIDHFKRVNDTHGHVIGDKVIRFVAKTLKEHACDNCLAARYGGEEFTLLYPASSLEEATALAEGIRHTIREARLVRTGSRESIGQVTISGGVAGYRPDQDPTDLIQQADEALYAAKHGGRDRIMVD
ncbi:MAG: hypothetical protein B0D96_05615 [Candidatus Sedimenticola endophacoides]|nr:MAG: hypothetical protein B0D96_05615 [Candidatus Sedimenticola endophacoides]OQX36177.1 MAG: hypothetical protein B0D84_01715 [Candidatus Sedimenticola endophacoides]OQX40727.1 MAG: hypothetical protein B0D89_06695 [Candidatus Sedimenticola endophacoides]OQX44231.1 MAG: hypothetical protein B0D88_02895 [Candidatus Sedimenticola endophacoides]OQX45279.1 MAG: hypothetical protein B0D85_05855 [Candidatus Sedimenticola endophacoides]